MPLGLNLYSQTQRITSSYDDSFSVFFCACEWPSYDLFSFFRLA